MRCQRDSAIFTLTCSAIMQNNLHPPTLARQLFANMQLLVLFALAGLLNGCATTLSSQVSIVHAWPEGLQEKSYRFETSARSENDVQYARYQAMLGTELQSLGFIESSAADTEHAARLSVAMEYASTASEMPDGMSSPTMMMMMSPLHFPPSPHHSSFSGQTHSLWMLSNLSAPKYYLHQLKILIRDRKSAAQLADIRASTEQPNPDIAAIMPYLMISALKQFPGQSGSTTMVTLPRSLPAKK